MVDVAVAPGELALSRAAIDEWVRRAGGQAVGGY